MASAAITVSSTIAFAPQSTPPLTQRCPSCLRQIACSRASTLRDSSSLCIHAWWQSRLDTTGTTSMLAQLLALLTFNHLQRCTGKRPSIELVRRHRCCTTCGSLLLTLLACRMLQSAHRTEQHIELIDSHLPQSLRNETTTITTMRRMEPKPVASSDSPPLKVRSPLSLAIVHSRLQ